MEFFRPGPDFNHLDTEYRSLLVHSASHTEYVLHCSGKGDWSLSSHSVFRGDQCFLFSGTMFDCPWCLWCFSTLSSCLLSLVSFRFHFLFSILHSIRFPFKSHLQHWIRLNHIPTSFEFYRRRTAEMTIHRHRRDDYTVPTI